VSRGLFDHLTITAPSLGEGEAWVRALLGVEPAPGGRHPRMATHNRLLRLGDTGFLEIIAPDPHAPTPERPRWFALDSLSASAPPALSAWVLRTTDIQASIAHSSEDLGQIEPMQRGELNWWITIPADGSLPLDGVAPILIEWKGTGHPAAGLPDCGCSLHALELRHPQPDRVRALLASLSVAMDDTAIQVRQGETPALIAQIDTPRGRRQLGSARM
jgi:hypothetical protein